MLCLAIGAAMAVDYCGKMRCAKKPHVACNSPAANKVSEKRDKKNVSSKKKKIDQCIANKTVFIVEKFRSDSLRFRTF